MNKKRSSFDNEINSNGKELLQICKSLNLNILNGRKSGDTLGKPTYYNYKGFSVVDYFITDQDCFHEIESFVVKAPNYLSDHSQIVTWLAISKSNEHFSDSIDNSLSYKIPERYIWDSESPDKFKRSLEHNETQYLINNFMMTNYSSSPDAIKTAISDFNTILTTSAKHSLKITSKKRRLKRNGENVINKKWFDRDCRFQRIKLRCLSNKKHRDPKDIHIRENYYKELKLYRTLLKKKRLAFETKKLSEIENENDPKKFWKLLKSMDDVDKFNDEPPIKRNDWLNHFQSLHQREPQNANNEKLEKDLI